MKIKLVDIDGLDFTSFNSLYEKGSSQQLLMLAILHYRPSERGLFQSVMVNAYDYYDRRKAPVKPKAIIDMIAFYTENAHHNLTTEKPSFFEPLMYTYRGLRYMMDKEWDEAKKAFEKLDEPNFISSYCLANIYSRHLSKPNLSLAKKFYDEVINGSAIVEIMSNALYERAMLRDENVPNIGSDRSLELLYQAAALNHAGALETLKEQNTLESKRYVYVLSVTGEDYEVAEKMQSQDKQADLKLLNSKLCELLESGKMKSLKFKWLCQYIKTSESMVSNIYQIFGPFFVQALILNKFTMKLLLEIYDYSPSLVASLRLALVQHQAPPKFLKDLSDQVSVKFKDVKWLENFIKINPEKWSAQPQLEECRAWLETIKDDIAKSIERDKKLAFLETLVELGYRGVETYFKDAFNTIANFAISQHQSLKLSSSLEQVKTFAIKGHGSSKKYLSEICNKQAKALYDNARAAQSGLTILKRDEGKYPEYKYWLARFYEESLNVFAYGSEKGRVIQRYKEAASAGFLPAYERLGDCYSNGVIAVADKDIELADYYYCEATEQGLDCRKKLSSTMTGQLYKAMLDGLTGSVSKCYGNAELRELFEAKDLGYLVKVILKICALPSAKIHGRVSLLQAAADKFSPSDQLNDSLLDLLRIGLEDATSHQSNLKIFLETIVEYLNPKYFSSLALAYFSRDDISYQMRCMILYAAKYLIKLYPNAVDDSFENILSTFKTATIDNFTEITRLLNFSLVSPDEVSSTKTTGNPSATGRQTNFFTVGPSQLKTEAKSYHDQLVEVGYDVESVPVMFYDNVQCRVIQDPILGTDGRFYDTGTYEQLLATNGGRSPVDENHILGKGIAHPIGYIEMLELFVASIKKEYVARQARSENKNTIIPQSLDY